MQPGILDDLAPAGGVAVLELAPGASAERVAACLPTIEIDGSVIVGIGAPLADALDLRVEGLRPFPALSGPGCAFPSTQGALWIHTRGVDPGAALLRLRGVLAAIGEDVVVSEHVMTYRHGGHDLSEYEDGTENPTGDRAIAAARAPDGGAFCAVQRWSHALAHLEALDPDARDAVIGRRLADNVELPDAPASAHVKRTAQESFDPPAFMVRRSMPYGDLEDHGLYFIAYVAALDTFERQLRRMAGLDDGIVDALLTFSRARTGGYYWCPPIREGRLVLRG